MSRIDLKALSTNDLVKLVQDAADELRSRVRPKLEDVDATTFAAEVQRRLGVSSAPTNTWVRLNAQNGGKVWYAGRVCTGALEIHKQPGGPIAFKLAADRYGEVIADVGVSAPAWYLAQRQGEREAEVGVNPSDSGV